MLAGETIPGLSALRRAQFGRQAFRHAVHLTRVHRGQQQPVRLRAHRPADLVALGSLTPQAASFLEASVRAGLNIIVRAAPRLE